MVGYEVEVHGLEEQLAKLRQYDAIADRRLMTAMRQSVITVESAIRPLTPVGVSGMLRNSIASEVKHLGPVNVEGIIGSTMKEAVYPQVMEFGRKPGPVRISDALMRWVQLKLGVPADLVEAATWYVARSISRKGIRERRFMKRGWEASQGKVEGYFAKALELIALDLENGRK